MKAKLIFKGGSGSGNFGHAGRPGKVGGSAAGRGAGHGPGGVFTQAAPNPGAPKSDTGDRMTDLLNDSNADLVDDAWAMGASQVSPLSYGEKRDVWFNDLKLAREFTAHINANSKAHKAGKPAKQNTGAFGNVYRVVTNVDYTKAKANK